MELSSGIIAACVPTCIAVFRRKRFEAKKSAGYSYSGGSAGGQETPMAPHPGSHNRSMLASDEELDLLHARNPHSQPPKSSSVKTSMSRD